jgi:hypothetical protein
VAGDTLAIEALDKMVQGVVLSFFLSIWNSSRRVTWDEWCLGVWEIQFLLPTFSSTSDTMIFLQEKQQ